MKKLFLPAIIEKEFPPIVPSALKTGVVSANGSSTTSFLQEEKRNINARKNTVVNFVFILKI